MAELPKTYDPASVEPKWYARWLESKAFRADASSDKPAFSIVIPPPNVTGVLTLGHVLNNTIQDILARRARMLGHEVLWLPGTDHAGIGTQTAVEKWLRKNEGVTRHDLGREEFLRRVLEWQDKHGGIIIEQLKRLGCSCDWSRERYTLDPEYAAAVQRVFVALCEKGLIYRGRRMINWDPAAQTALSDEEVISKPQKANLFFVKYEIAEQPGQFVEVATTRPETIMADVAVAVHPNDKRYRGVVGKNVWRPLAREKIPIIADEAIDPEFGTGVLKVTPAHDKLDFEIGQRHRLPVIDVLTADGRINCPAVPALHNLDRFRARERAAELLQKDDLLAKAEPYESNVGFSDRSDVPIEPRLSEQWFLHYPKTRGALAVVRDHLIRFFPPHWEKVYAQWLENIQDWCISRQVWWGHRIPAWYHTKAGSGDQTGKGDQIRVQIESPGQGWTQDPDTLDTWFSSWLWAYETMDPATRAKFYPTSVLVTAPDIIFFWVARMIIAGLEFRPGKSQNDEDNIPFRDVFFTGLIRDSKGRKMSKSLGNSPDPLDLIAKYGADGLRFGLMRIAPTGQDIRFDDKQVEEGRNFATKLWNAARFRQLYADVVPGKIFDSDAQERADALSAEDKWILMRLDGAIRDVSAALEAYQFNHAANALYRFFWSEFCDWYLEASKAALNGADARLRAATLAVFDFVFEKTLRLIHPFMPFITEELFELLEYRKAGATVLDFARWPEQFKVDFKQKYDIGPAAEEFGYMLHEVVEAGRGLRRDFNLASNARVRFLIRPGVELSRNDLESLRILLNAVALDVVPDNWRPPKQTPGSRVRAGEIFLPLEGMIDPAQERQRIDKEITRIEQDLEMLQSKLTNDSFIQRAPEEVVQEHRARRDGLKQRLHHLQQAQASLD